MAYSATFNFNPSRGQHEEDVYYVRVAPSTSGITMVSAASRLTHGAAGTFDIAMPRTGVSGVQDRRSSTYNAVFTFDAPVTSGEVTLLGGTATVGTISFSGNSMTAQLTSATSAEVVTLRVQNINGDGQSHGDVPFGFLTADVNGNRIVDRPDQQQLAGRPRPAGHCHQLPRRHQSKWYSGQARPPVGPNEQGPFHSIIWDHRRINWRIRSSKCWLLCSGRQLY